MRLVHALMLSVLAIFALGFIAGRCSAQSGNHGDGHGEMHEIYKGWQSPQGYSCCSEQDCRPTRAYLDEHGHWQAIVDGRWLVMPDDRVLRIPSPDGRSHVCATPGAAPTIRCFVPGEIRS